MVIWVRAMLIGFPLALAALFLTSYMAVRPGELKLRNEMITGSTGEAKMLNPILSTSTSDSAIEDCVFEGLLKYDENLEIAPCLAESWVLGQTTTFAFSKSEDATAAATVLKGQEAQWAGWNLKAAETNGSELILRFSVPGSLASGEIAKLLEGLKPLPFANIRVELKNSAPESSAAVKTSIPSKDRIRRVWVDTSSAYEMTVTGDSAPVLEELKQFYAANGSLEAKSQVTDTVPWLDEPDILFKLRTDVKWHDGEPFTSKDVEFTYRMIMDETIASPRRSDYEVIESVEALAPDQVRVVYRKPYSPALLSWMMGMLPEHILGGRSKDWWADNFNRRPIGTGPFKFSEWKSSEYVSIMRNEDYYLGAPKLERIFFRTIPDGMTLRLAFETKQVDFWGVDDHAVSKLKEDPRFEIFTSPGPGYEYIGWNLRRPIFKDVRVRRAFAQAVDIQSIIKYVMYGYGTQSKGTFPPQMWFANPDITPYPYDPAEAKRLLDEAGWKPNARGILEKDGEPLSFTLLTSNTSDTRKDIATLVQADLKKIGVEVKLESYEWTIFINQKVHKQDFDAVVLGWSTGYDYDQYQLWHSSQTNPGQLNFCGYVNPEVDKLLVSMRTEFDQERIKEFASRLQQIIYEDQPYLFLSAPQSIAAMWRDSYRIHRPDGKGGWIEEPVKLTKAGFRIYNEWFYRPSIGPELKP